MRFLSILLSLLCAATAFSREMDAASAKHGNSLGPEQLGVVVNDADINSVEVGQYYMQARRIPPKNLVHVNIANSPHKLGDSQFSLIKQQIEAQLGPEIQAVVMVWTAPYAVECNSITSAFTLGFDAGQCINTCAAGKPSRYYNSSSRRPYNDLGIRLSMLLPTDSVEQAKALIDRGAISGFRVQPANAYFLSTTDSARNVRARFFPKSGDVPQRQLAIKNMSANSIENVDDIMFYQIGLPIVPNLSTLHFLPGALADHLTSFGGDLLGNNSQMSSLRWLAAGATASYGTVSEPCNHWQKFPHPQLLLKAYLSGATAIEAYWKSVGWPTQGVFIGEPLAAPYHQ